MSLLGSLYKKITRHQQFEHFCNPAYTLLLHKMWSDYLVLWPWVQHGYAWNADVFYDDTEIIYHRGVNTTNICEMQTIHFIILEGCDVITSIRRGKMANIQFGQNLEAIFRENGGLSEDGTTHVEFVMPKSTFPQKFGQGFALGETIQTPKDGTQTSIIKLLKKKMKFYICLHQSY